MLIRDAHVRHEHNISCLLTEHAAPCCGSPAAGGSTSLLTCDIQVLCPELPRALHVRRQQPQLGLYNQAQPYTQPISKFFDDWRTNMVFQTITPRSLRWSWLPQLIHKGRPEPGGRTQDSRRRRSARIITHDPGATRA